ncbi:MAG: protein kinase [Planctomycetota bacterium]
MNEEQLTRVEELYLGALEREPDERAAYLDEACNGDAEVRAEVERVLASHSAMGSFLESPAFLALEREPLPAGTQVGRYEILEMIAEGGSGEVYLARQSRPRRRVALKRMRALLETDESIRDFLKEAEIAARLKHPGVAHVYEAGMHAGVPYFAMEYVDGAETVVSRRLDPRDAVQLFLRICEAVQHGHQRGVIHRDLKPGNVLIDAQGQPKVIDFGIALSGDGPASTAGTVPYMSPEQVDGEADVRSDVYSLGVLLYELLQGGRPRDLDGLSAAEAAARVRSEPLPSFAPADLSSIVAKAAAPAPEHRYASVGEMTADLRRYLERRPVLAYDGGLLYQWGRLARRHRAALAATLLIVVVCIGAAVVSTRQAMRAERERTAADWQAYLGNISAAEAALRIFDLAEARRRLERIPVPQRAWEWRHLHARTERGVPEYRVPGRYLQAGAAGPNGLLAAVGLSEPMRWWIWVHDSRTKKTLIERQGRFGFAFGMAFHPAGKLLVVGDRTGRLLRFGLPDGEELPPLQGPAALINELAFAPDGARLASAARDGSITIWRVPAWTQRVLTGHTDRAICLCFDPSGDALWSGSRDGEIRRWNLADGKTTKVLRGHQGSVESIALTADGKTLLSVSRDRTLRFWDAATGSEIGRRQAHGANVRSVAVHPTKPWVATGSYDGTSAIWDLHRRERLFLVPNPGGSVMRVFFDPEGKELLSFGGSGTVRRWNPERPDAVPTLRGHTDTLDRLAFVDGGRRLVSRNRVGELCLWDVESRRLVWPRKAARRRAPLGAGDDGLLVAPTSTGALRVRMSDGSDVPWTGEQPALRDGVQQGAYVVGVADDATVERAHLEAGAVARATIANENVDGVRMEPGEGVTLAFTRTGRVFLLEGEGLRQGAHSRPHEERIFDAAYSPDGALIATASADATLALLDARTLEIRARLRGHRQRVHCVAFSPDGKRLASGSEDGTIRLWDTESGDQVVILRAQSGPTHALAFSPDGSTLASGHGHWEDAASVKIKLWSTR